MFSFVAAASF